MDGFQLRNRVREIRKRLRMRQSDLAAETGLTRQTIIALEKSRLNPSILVSLKIARVLKEPVDYVFYLDRQEERAEKEPASPPVTARTVQEERAPAGDDSPIEAEEVAAGLSVEADTAPREVAAGLIPESTGAIVYDPETAEVAAVIAADPPNPDLPERVNKVNARESGPENPVTVAEAVPGGGPKTLTDTAEKPVQASWDF